MRFPALALSILALAFSGCAAPPAAATGELRNADFLCTNDEPVRLQFDAAHARATLLRNGQHLYLDQQPSGSGFRYAGSGTSVSGKGDEITIESGGAPPLRCQLAR